MTGGSLFYHHEPATFKYLVVLVQEAVVVESAVKPVEINSCTEVEVGDLLYFFTHEVVYL